MQVIHSLESIPYVIIPLDVGSLKVSVAHWFTWIFIMSDGRKKVSEVCPISVDVANIKLEYKETCI